MSRRVEVALRFLPWLLGIAALGLALAGAAGVAWVVGLNVRTAAVFVAAVGLLAVFASAIPVARLTAAGMRAQSLNRQESGR